MYQRLSLFIAWGMAWEWGQQFESHVCRTTSKVAQLGWCLGKREERGETDPWDPEMRSRGWEEGEKKNPKTKPPKFLSSQNEGLHSRMKGLSNRTRQFLLRKTWRIHALTSAEERVRTGLSNQAWCWTFSWFVLIAVSLGVLFVSIFTSGETEA